MTGTKSFTKTEAKKLEEEPTTTTTTTTEPTFGIVDAAWKWPCGSGRGRHTEVTTRVASLRQT